MGHDGSCVRHRHLLLVETGRRAVLAHRFGYVTRDDAAPPEQQLPVVRRVPALSDDLVRLSLSPDRTQVAVVGTRGVGTEIGAPHREEARAVRIRARLAALIARAAEPGA